MSEIREVPAELLPANVTCPRHEAASPIERAWSSTDYRGKRNEYVTLAACGCTLRSDNGTPVAL